MRGDAQLLKHGYLKYRTEVCVLNFVDVDGVDLSSDLQG